MLKTFYPVCIRSVKLGFEAKRATVGPELPRFALRGTLRGTTYHGGLDWVP